MLRQSTEERFTNTLFWNAIILPLQQRSSCNLAFTDLFPAIRYKPGIIPHSQVPIVLPESQQPLRGAGQDADFDGRNDLLCGALQGPLVRPSTWPAEDGVLRASVSASAGAGSNAHPENEDVKDLKDVKRSILQNAEHAENKENVYASAAVQSLTSPHLDEHGGKVKREHERASSLGLGSKRESGRGLEVGFQRGYERGYEKGFEGILSSDSLLLESGDKRTPQEEGNDLNFEDSALGEKFSAASAVSVASAVSGLSAPASAPTAEQTRISDWCQYVAKEIGLQMKLPPSPQLQQDALLEIVFGGSLEAEKERVKQWLRRYDRSFNRKFGRLPTRNEKEPMRPVYLYYRLIKQAGARYGYQVKQSAPTAAAIAAAITPPANLQTQAQTQKRQQEPKSTTLRPQGIASQRLLPCDNISKASALRFEPNEAAQGRGQPLRESKVKTSGEVSPQPDRLLTRIVPANGPSNSALYCRGSTESFTSKGSDQSNDCLTIDQIQKKLYVLLNPWLHTMDLPLLLIALSLKFGSMSDSFLLAGPSTKSRKNYSLGGYKSSRKNSSRKLGDAFGITRI